DVLHRQRLGGDPWDGVLFDAPRVDALPAPYRTRTASRPLVEPRAKAADLFRATALPIRIVAGAQRLGGVLQIGVAVPVRARARLYLQGVRRQQAEPDALGGDRRAAGIALSGDDDDERAARKRRGG